MRWALLLLVVGCGSTQPKQPIRPAPPLPKGVVPEATPAAPSIVEPTETASMPLAPGAPAGRKLSRKYVPKYPKSAMRIGLSGTVILVAQVTSDGEVAAAKVVGTRFSGVSASAKWVAASEDLKRAAQQAVLKWRYEPRPGPTRPMRTTVKFVLDGGAKPTQRRIKTH